MTAAARLGLALLLACAAGGCKGKKKEEPAPDKAAAAKERPSVPPSPGFEPDLPDPVALDCGRIVPDEVRAAHLPGLAVDPTIHGPIATCAFGDPKALRPSVSLFCHRRKRNWNFADELARDKRKTAVEGVGRAAYAREDHVFFYPAKLDCLARVIWPADAAKATALAKAVDAQLSKASVTAAPAN